MKRGIKALLMLLAMLIITGCGDDPSSVGSGLIPDKITIKDFDSELDSVNKSSGSFRKVVSLNGASFFLAGRADGITASSLIRFDFSIFPYKTDLKNDSLIIRSAKVRLTPFYFYGDTSSHVPLEAYKVYNNWSSGSLNNDSIPDLIVPRENLIVPGSQTSSDSAYTFNLQNSIVKEWLYSVSDTTGFVNNGLMITGAAGGTRIAGFRSFSTDEYIIPSIELVLEKTGSYVDTVIYFLLEDIHVVEGGALTLPADRLLVRSGFVDFSKLYFDLSKLPAGAIINKAVLTLHVDTVNTKTGDNIENLLYAYFMSDSLANKYETITASQLSRAGATYTGEVTSIITRMLFQNNNQGIALTPGSLSDGVERFVLYSTTHPDPLLRPRLQIYYSVAE
ncbi:MAG: hypothetical protein AMXMBFR48_06580 [Ignavibacteriales bacterium]